MTRRQDQLVRKLQAMRARYIALGLRNLADIVTNQLAELGAPLEPPRKVPHA